MQGLNRLPLSGLRAIEAIARRGTLAAAAEELGVTPGALSQRLAKAEQALGRTLFLRSPRGLEPTDLLVEVLPRLTGGFRELSAAVSRLDHSRDCTLTISVAPLFASRWLVWRLHRFNARHPEISVRIDPSVALKDPDTSDVDLGIRVGRGPWPGVRAEWLLDQLVFPVCRPDIAARLATPADIPGVPVIRENAELYGWDAWLAPYGMAADDIGDGPTYADAGLCLDAAMTGQGVFLAWEMLAATPLEQGSLVVPFPDRRPTGAAYWLVSGKTSDRRPGARRFRAWLREELDISLRHWRQDGAPGTTP